MQGLKCFTLPASPPRGPWHVPRSGRAAVPPFGPVKMFYEPHTIMSFKVP